MARLFHSHLLYKSKKHISILRCPASPLLRSRHCPAQFRSAQKYIYIIYKSLNFIFWLNILTFGQSWDALEVDLTCFQTCLLYVAMVLFQIFKERNLTIVSIVWQIAFHWCQALTDAAYWEFLPFWCTDMRRHRKDEVEFTLIRVPTCLSKFFLVNVKLDFCALPKSLIQGCSNACAAVKRLSASVVNNFDIKSLALQHTKNMLIACKYYWPELRMLDTMDKIHQVNVVMMLVCWNLAQLWRWWTLWFIRPEENLCKDLQQLFNSTNCLFWRRGM